MDFNEENDMVEFAEINMTPMVDVMLVLLIIFMMSIAFVYHSVDVNVPEFSKNSGKQSHSVVLNIDLDGQLYIDNQLVSAQQLKQQLAQRHIESTININADKQVSYQQLIELMLLIQSTGLEKIQFVTPITSNK
jgi:biopolymer transport protein ExbD